MGKYDDLLAKIPTLETLDAVDDDKLSGTRPCPLNALTLNDVRLLRIMLVKEAEREKL